VSSSHRLQRYVDEVIRCFYERAPDIMEEMEGRGVKLHATIMNSTFRRSSSPVKPNRKRYESTFDCRGIMKVSLRDIKVVRKHDYNSCIHICIHI